MEVVCNNLIELLKFFIGKESRAAILGLQASELSGIVERVSKISCDYFSAVTSIFSMSFGGLGCTKQAYHMVLRGGTRPTAQAALRIPQVSRQPRKKELQRLTGQKITQKVDEPMHFVRPLVTALKKTASSGYAWNPAA